LVVFGLGKLGGGELNAGSDVDIVLLYDTDEGQAGGATLHEYWTAVARRAVTMLETPTEDGFVWRVDLRLRPEGSRGPLVYSAAAAERYYETWGRLWERAALLRARPVAGDLALGVRLQRAVIEPFVYRRTVDPSVATLLAELLRRSRLEARVDDALDLKLGRGGIREAEFFVQALQLVWGGREPSLRVTGTLAALARLESRGLVSDREARDVARAYRLLRRAEHVVQNRTGIQTHSLPRGGGELGAVARILGFPSEGALAAALRSARAAVTQCFASTQAELLRPAPRYTALLAELEQGGSGVWVAAREHFGDADVEEHLRALARRPDSLLGSLTRERHPVLADRVLDALCASADPEAAARYLRSFLARVSSTGSYVAALAEDARAAKRLVTVLGASALVGDAIAARPDLVDVVLSRSEVVTVAAARRTVDQELELAEPELVAKRDENERRDALIGALRRAQWRVTLDVAVADLAGEIGTREVTRVLSALAERILQRAVEIAAQGGDARGLAVIAVGKLGGAELGYGSDLDVLFVYDPAAAPVGSDPEEHFTRLAQRTLRVLGESHALGQGYELDTRLRPSGAQGLLVTSLRAFARYHRCEDPGEVGEAPSPGVLSSG
ncbi:MAG: bifunctional [glutamate--ammonia ligase]-adenylyl-L-tyrosine phosphorylase/[glutamate--ammonia-ligase] adenylyltransferase, partial [Deltaproteobacteria bacterium]|nr:bifunctional [glutamate--ammonia ligase]-adenylyl-L-tyrosine phosphorylase/[glutamate--ammonia-ligase] adenylyltransferase [Deltaproteobacteria bacterium]